MREGPASDAVTARVVASTSTNRSRMVDMNDHVPDNASVPAPAAARDEPAELTTIVDLLSDYAAAGYDTELSVTVDARVHCKACGEDTAAVAMQLDSLRRIEGASDPDDMQVVVALVCRCSAKGALVLGYGPNAGEDDANVLVGLQDHRGESDISPSQPPARPR